jgi:PAS domain S-box-containing protein
VTGRRVPGPANSMFSVTRPRTEPSGTGSVRRALTRGASGPVAADLGPHPWPVDGALREPAAGLDALPDAVLVIGADRRILIANMAAERLLGQTRDELVGRSCVQLLDPRYPDGSPVWAHGWDVGAGLRSVRRLAEQVVTLHPAGGRPLVVAVSGAYRRDADGTLMGFIACLRRHRPPPDAAVGMISAVSHELRSPLTSVKGYSRLLLNRWDLLHDDDKKLMLEQVVHDADRVSRLVGELLDISRLESGNLVLHRRLVDLAELTASVVGKVGLEYPVIDVRTGWEDGFPLVYADPDKIEQVLTNLLENACKYASPTGLVVLGSIGPAPAGEVVVTVADSGVGIPPEDLSKVFDMFFRPAGSRPNGTGLGLWISRGLIESHGGRLVAESTLGQGSRFSFTLPIVDLEDLAAP